MSQDVMNRLLEKIENKYYGKYRATVSQNKDTENMARITMKIPELLGDEKETGWALPCLPYGGGEEDGFLFIPEVGSNVWAEFEGGNLSYPIWTGVWWSKDKIPSESNDMEDNPLKILKTKAGHQIKFSDKDPPDEESILVQSTTGHKIALDESSGSEQITVTSAQGHSITIDDTEKKIEIKTSGGNEITLDDTDSKITIKNSGGESIELSPSSGITIKSGSAVSIEGVDVTVKASASMTLDGGPMLTLKGGMIMLN